MVLKSNSWLNGVAKAIQHGEVAAWIGPQHVLKGLVAEFRDGAEELEVCDLPLTDREGLTRRSNREIQTTRKLENQVSTVSFVRSSDTKKNAFPG